MTGTSAESGDDGGTGRGNRANGLITPNRPMTMESLAGKNPVTHVGKLYNLLASLISADLVEAIPEAGLDVTLEVIDPISVGDGGLGTGIMRLNEHGPGVSEFTYIQGSAAGWQIVVVKKVSGAGPVTLRLREADTVTHLAAVCSCRAF